MKPQIQVRTPLCQEEGAGMPLRALMEALEQNPSAGPMVAFLRRQRSQAGFRTMLGCLRRMAAMCGHSLETWQPHTLGALGVQALALKIQKGTTKTGQQWSPAYIAAHEAALSGLLDQFWALEMINQEQLARLKFWKRVQVRRSLQAPCHGRYMSGAERRRLWDAANHLGTLPVIQARDRAFLALLLCGLRREETTAISMTDLLEGGLLRIQGKGDRIRYLLLEHWSQVAIEDWLRFRGEVPGPLLLPVDRHGKMRSKRWSLAAASKRFKEIASAAGVTDVTPHDVRRTFASEALESGHDIVKVARWLGHADVRTTALYDRRPISSLRGLGGPILMPLRNKQESRFGQVTPQSD